MSTTRKRGFAHERDLASRFWNYGFAVLRAPASGSKTKRLLYPDLIAIYKGKVLVFEIKTMKKPRSLYIEQNQIKKLVEFADRAGGEAYLAVKVVGSGEWVFIPIYKLEKTEKGTFKVKRDVISEGYRFEALVSIIKGVKKLTDFTKEP